MRQYFKTLDGSGWYGFKPTTVPLEELIEITKEEWENHLKGINSIEVDEEQFARDARINELKMFLAETDYKAIKYAEGELSEEEYAPIKAQRRAWREEINQLTNK